MNPIRFATLLCSISAFCPAFAVDEVPSAATQRITEIHIPRENRATQMAWLARQVAVGGFLDAGDNWDPPPRAEQDRELPAFDFKEGSLGEALDAFCGPRGLRWRWWKKAGRLWIEPTEPKNRVAEVFVDRPFKDRLAPILKEPGRGDKLYIEDIGAAWNSTRNLPQEKNLVLEARQPTQGGVVLRGGSGAMAKILVNDAASVPSSFSEFLCLWLRVDKAQYAMLYSGPPNVKIDFGKIDVGRREIPLEVLVKTLLVPLDGDKDKNEAHGECTEELYRRLKADPQPVLAELRKQDFLVKVDILSILGGLSNFVDWAPDTFGKYVVEQFGQLPLKAQKDIVRYMSLDQPEERGAHFVQFWEKLSHSEDADLRKKATWRLEEYQEARRKNGK